MQEGVDPVLPDTSTQALAAALGSSSASGPVDSQEDGLRPDCSGCDANS